MRGFSLWGLLCCTAIQAFATDDAIFTYRVGAFEVYMLVENRGQGGTSILLGADEGTLKQYVGGAGFQSEVNTFLIRTADRRYILVDTGFGTTLFESMKTLGVRPEQIDAVLITHLHGDHIGGLQKDDKAQFPRAKVYLARQERDYWTVSNVNNAAVQALGAYKSRVETFEPGALGAQKTELFPGISAIAAFGHTPGHTLYMLESQGQRLLIWGDLMHVQSIQFPRPDISVTYDTDPAAAAETRRKVLEYATANSIPVGGMHLLYPAIGQVSAQGQGYRFTAAR